MVTNSQEITHASAIVCRGNFIRKNESVNIGEANFWPTTIILR